MFHTVKMYFSKKNVVIDGGDLSILTTFNEISTFSLHYNYITFCRIEALYDTLPDKFCISGSFGCREESTDIFKTYLDLDSYMIASLPRSFYLVAVEIICDYKKITSVDHVTKVFNSIIKIYQEKEPWDKDTLKSIILQIEKQKEFKLTYVNRFAGSIFSAINFMYPPHLFYLLTCDISNFNNKLYDKNEYDFNDSLYLVPLVHMLLNYDKYRIDLLQLLHPILKLGLQAVPSRGMYVHGINSYIRTWGYMLFDTVFKILSDLSKKIYTSLHEDEDYEGEDYY